MVDTITRSHLDALVRAVRTQPTVLPLAEVVQLARRPVSIVLDRTGGETVAVIAPRPDERFDGLTNREREVAGLVASGYSNRQIAAALSISLATAKDHVHAILAKTGLPSRAAVAAAWSGNR